MPSLLCRATRGGCFRVCTRGYRECYRAQELHQCRASPKSKVYIPRVGTCKRWRYILSTWSILHLWRAYRTYYRRFQHRRSDDMGNMRCGMHLRNGNGIVGNTSHPCRDFTNATRAKRIAYSIHSASSATPASTAIARISSRR